MKKVLYFLRDLFWKNKLKKVVGTILYIVVLFVILAIVAPKQEVPRHAVITTGSPEFYSMLVSTEKDLEKELLKKPVGSQDYKNIMHALIEIKEQKNDYKSSQNAE